MCCFGIPLENDTLDGEAEDMDVTYKFFSQRYAENLMDILEKSFATLYPGYTPEDYISETKLDIMMTDIIELRAKLEASQQNCKELRGLLWQTDERKIDEEIVNGQYKSFASMDESIADLTSDDEPDYEALFLELKSHVIRAFKQACPNPSEMHEFNMPYFLASNLIEWRGFANGLINQRTEPPINLQEMLEQLKEMLIEEIT